MQSVTGDGSSFLSILLGGSMSKMSLFALSISPYITASIVIQLMTVIIPKLEEMQKDGKVGQDRYKKVISVTGIIFSFVQAVMMAVGFGSQGLLSPYNIWTVIGATAIWTLGAVILILVGEFLDNFQLGSGISMILLCNILYIYLPGDNEIKYDSTTNYLELNGSTIVRTISAVDATYDGISEFTDQDGQQVLIGEKIIDDTSAIAVVHTVPASGDGVTVDMEAETQEVQSILDGAHAKVTITEASLFGYAINPEWVEDMVITNKGAELIKGDKSIYVAPYTGTFAQGTTNTLRAGSLSLTYSDSIKDSTTGYTPYILGFSEKQDGTSTSSRTSLQAKILATSNLEVKDLFMAD